MDTEATEETSELRMNDVVGAFGNSFIIDL